MTGELKQGVCEVLEYLSAIGIDYLPVPQSSIKAVAGKQTAAAAGKPAPKPSEPPARIPVPAAAAYNPDKETALKAVRADIGDCRRCALSRERKNIVFGEGNPDARIMFIGEAPGREEDMQARPFVGEAGQQLTGLIEKLGFRRDDVYIANICKCRPPENRNPEEAEIAACFPFLDEQIRIISPGVIVALGKIATYNLMKPSTPITKFSILRERGKWFEYKGVPVMPTTHPAYWLRNRSDKHQVLKEAQEAAAKLRASKGER
jgi:uracil-DNA glycosylase